MGICRSRWASTSICDDEEGGGAVRPLFFCFGVRSNAAYVISDEPVLDRLRLSYRELTAQRPRRPSDDNRPTDKTTDPPQTAPRLPSTRTGGPPLHPRAHEGGIAGGTAILAAWAAGR